MASRAPAVLEPGSRRLFLDSLRPPDGYHVDRVLGTTFTLDLLALLAVPLAFTFRDAEDREGSIATDPLALIEGARRHAEHMTLFVHAGRAAVPRPGQAALAFLEGSVIETLPADIGPASIGAIFHPKIWVLRFVGESGAVRYRFICQSRNLTFDQSWDVALVLEGDLQQQRTNAFAANHPLADFVADLPALALRQRSLEAWHRETIEILSRELRRVRFELPDGFEEYAFWPLGIGSRSRQDPLPGYHGRPLLVISPFLDKSFLARAAQDRPRSVFIGRHEELVRAPINALDGFDDIFEFRSALEPEVEDALSSAPALAGLHAKALVIDDGWKSRVFVGSANATSAALGPQSRNVEFMTELVGPKSRFGIDALLREEAEASAVGRFRSLIKEFDRNDLSTVDEDKVGLRLQWVIEAMGESLARLGITARVDQDSTGRFGMHFNVPEGAERPPEVTAVHCWPSSLAGDSARRPLTNGLEFRDLSLEELTGFLAVEVTATVEGRSDRGRFLLTVPLAGVPADRLQRLVAGLVGNRAQLLKLLWLLLSPDGELSVDDLLEVGAASAEGAQWSVAVPGLLERMLETLAQAPNRLDAVASLIRDLQATDVGRDVLGPRFMEIWKPLEAARVGRRR